MGDVRIAAVQDRPRGRAGRGGPAQHRRSARSTTASRRAAGLAVWYLRAVAFVNFLSAVWVSLGQDVRRHNQADFFTPYLLTAGFASGVFTVFLAITMRRRKRAAWILNLVLAGAFLVLFAVAMAFPEVRRYAQNWVSLALTAVFVAALLVGRREFYAKGDRSNPKLAAAVAVGGLLVSSLLAALLVTVTNQAPRLLDLRRPLAVRHPAAGLRRRRRLPLPRDHDAQLGERRHQRAQHGPGPRRPLRRLPLPACRRPAHRGRRAAAAGAP